MSEFAIQGGAQASMAILSADAYSNVTFTGSGGEMLRIAKDGFYVRGIKLEQDADEARKVFEAMREFLQSTGAYK